MVFSRKWFEKRRREKQLEAQRDATEQLLTLAGFNVTNNYISEYCHLCGERMCPLSTSHTETSPHGEDIVIRDKQGCACLRCGFVKKVREGYNYLYEKPVPFDVFVNDYLERQLQ